MSKQAKKEAEPKESVVVNNSVVMAAPTQAPALSQAQVMNEWGMANTLTAKDIIIPKILVMQGLSKQVTTGKAVMGEFRDSLNGKLLGDIEKSPLEFIPFLLEKVWIVFEERNGTMKYTKTIPMDAANENWPYEEVINGVKIKRDRTMNFYVLLPSEVSAGGEIPYILSFRRTSARAGQKLATTMYVRNISANKTPASTALSLLGTRQSNDKGTFVVADVQEKRGSTPQEVASALAWVKRIKAGQTKVDDSDLESETTFAGGSSGAESKDF